MRTWPLWSGLLAVVSAVALAGSAAGAPTPAFGVDAWPMAGNGVTNTHAAYGEHTVVPGTVGTLSVAWTLTTTGDVRSTPVVAEGTVYVPDSGGTLWAVDAKTGAVRWSHQISDYTGVSGDVVRSSPAVYGDELVFGDTNGAGKGADVIAVNRLTGQLLWQNLVDTQLPAIITGSPVIYGGTVYAGVSSYEEAIATEPGYPCCSFRGSVVALNALTGQQQWKTYTVPTGYSGGAVWNSSPMIDPRNDLLYVGTGNNYTSPPGVCTDPGGTNCSPPPADDRADSVVAFNRFTGAPQWSHSTMTGDDYTEVCGLPPAAGCGPDFDFGSGPNLIQLPSGQQLVGAGQKSGTYWAFDPDTGATVWHTSVGPGSAMGGMEFGSATDGSHVYIAESGFYGLPYQITSATGVTTTTNGGSWAALDAATGKILWQVPDPQGGADFGYVSTAGGVVYAGSSADTGDDMYALDARTGNVLWSFASGGPVAGGASVVRGTVYWGSGFTTASLCPTGGTGPLNYCSGGNNKLFAFRSNS